MRGFLGIEFNDIVGCEKRDVYSLCFNLLDLHRFFLVSTNSCGLGSFSSKNCINWDDSLFLVVNT